jgi:glycosyltransferase involved in cell wall biosynthesis
MPQLSAFLITKNEAADISDCLRSLRGLADEVVVVDSGSTDDTVNVCRQSGARVITRTFDGFGAQKQFALDQTTGDWALSIDADERVTPQLAAEIRQTLQRNPEQDGFRIRRNFFFLGQRLRFGGLGGDWVLRLFRRAKGKFTNAPVHEKIVVDGPIADLKHPLDHYSYDSIKEYMEKCDHYTDLAAKERWERGRRFSWFDRVRPAWEFGVRTLIRGAWLDGRPGLTYAALSARATWMRATKLRDLEQRYGR